MGKDRQQFRFPMFGKFLLSASDLIALRDAFSDSGKQSTFMTNALR
jgi:hypothetical protein